MIELKPLIIDSTGWLEATWVELKKLPDVSGCEIETQVYCQSYHPAQINMLRDKAAEYGTPLEEYEQMLVEWVDSYVPEPPAPVAPVPRACTPPQGLLALFVVKGIKKTDVLAKIEAIPDEVERYKAQVAFESATRWEEGSPTMQMMQAAFSLTDADMDELFTYAQGVVP